MQHCSQLLRGQADWYCFLVSQHNFHSLPEEGAGCVWSGPKGDTKAALTWEAGLGIQESGHRHSPGPRVLQLCLPFLADPAP